MTTGATKIGMSDASRRILLCQRDRSLRIQRIQCKRLEVVAALLLCSTIEIDLIFTYWGVMPTWLVVLNAVCVLVNGILIVWLLSLYSDAKAKLEKRY